MEALPSPQCRRNTCRRGSWAHCSDGRRGLVSVPARPLASPRPPPSCCCKKACRVPEASSPERWSRRGLFSKFACLLCVCGREAYRNRSTSAVSSRRSPCCHRASKVNDGRGCEGRRYYDPGRKPVAVRWLGTSWEIAMSRRPFHRSPSSQIASS